MQKTERFAAWTPEPLQDAANSIRLMKFTRGSKDDVISLTSSVVPLQPGTPTITYNAISYAWGDAQGERCNLLVDGKSASVLRNCYYALWQLQLHDSEDCFWIDSICINQQDDVEKSAQVQKMCVIFKTALQVFASVGPSADDSDRLLTACAAFGQPKDRRSDTYQSLRPDAEDDLDNLMKRLDINKTQDLVSALKKFSRRPYWHRLWAVQETWRSSGVRIMCGSMLVDWRGVLNIVQAFAARDVLGNSGLGRGFYTHVSLKRSKEFYGSGLALRTAMWAHSHFECADVRDRIYGLIGIIDWSLSRVAPVEVDYAQSAWQLALQLTSGLYDTDEVRILARCLDVCYDSNDPTIRDIFQQRYDLETGEASMIRQTTARHRWEVKAKLGTQLTACAWIRGSDTIVARFCDRKPTSPPTRIPPVHRVEHAHTSRLLATGEYRLDSAVEGFKSLTCARKVAAIVCENAREGDLLIETGEDQLLVLRVHNHAFTVVGLGLLVNHARLPRPSLDRSSDSFKNKRVLHMPLDFNLIAHVDSFAAAVEVECTCEDLLIFVGQDMLKDARPQHRACCGRKVHTTAHEKAHIARLLVNPFLDPIGAVSLTEIEFDPPGGKDSNAMPPE